jgi:alpha-glutamyl/putrescinyl thymine pyrophosphorylase clade 1
MRTKDLFRFVNERYAVLQRRKQGLPKPWTQDPILQGYRFCNVYREDDTVTQWIKENWRDPHTSDPDVWFAMAVARYVNWPDTLAEIGYPVPWERRDGETKVGSYSMLEHFTNTLIMRGTAGEKVFTGAYMIHAGKGGSKVSHIANEVLLPLWEGRERVLESFSDPNTHSLNNFYNCLMEFNGVGSFMAGQIVCDTKYTRLLENTVDWWTFACPGPGSRRGLARVYKKPVTYNWNDRDWSFALFDLREAILPMIQKAGMPPLHAQDLQNCLCEFDKYERVRLGEGRPRSNYPGAI